MIRNTLYTVIFFIIYGVGSLQAEIRLPAIIGNHMVLPGGKDVNFWGWADPGENVHITVSWDTTKYIAIANIRTGKWMVKIMTSEAGGPHTIILQGKNRIALEDVLIGEVWLCGGQSNMEISACCKINFIRFKSNQ